MLLATRFTSRAWSSSFSCCCAAQVREGLQGHDAWWQCRHELRELWPRQFLAEKRAPVRRSAMKLEDLLCQIDADEAERQRDAAREAVRLHAQIEEGRR